jgi:hypothetical protein
VYHAGHHINIESVRPSIIQVSIEECKQKLLISGPAVERGQSETTMWPTSQVDSRQGESLLLRGRRCERPFVRESSLSLIGTSFAVQLSDLLEIWAIHHSLNFFVATSVDFEW